MTGGYVGDIEYAPHFVAEIAPAWLDLTLLIGGREPPSRRDGFTWCELGCGPGVTAALLAATHPRGRFHAVDMLPAHIEQASRLRDAVRADNLVLHEADFASIAERELPRFDYVVAHGVYSWVDASARAALRRFVERHLAPGGALYLSYNAMPGWRRDAPFQQLVRALATTQRGDSATRFAGAMRAVEAVHAVGAPALAESEMLRGRWEHQRAVLPPAYFAHEYLAEGWQPFYVTDVWREMAELGLAPSGSASIADNFDHFGLTDEGRTATQTIADPSLRELVRDYLIDQRFRRDVFVRAARRVDAGERGARLRRAPLALVVPPSLARHELESGAVRVRFDGPASRAVVSALAAGCRSVDDVAAATPQHTTSELLAAALALIAAGAVRPVDEATVDVVPLNRALFARTTGAEPSPYLLIPGGTAIRVARPVLDALCDGGAVDDETQPWLELCGRTASASR